MLKVHTGCRITVCDLFEWSKDQVVHSAPTLPEVFRHCFLRAIHDVPAVLGQPCPRGLATGPQVLHTRHLGGPEEVEEATSSLTIDAAFYRDHRVGVGNGDSSYNLSWPARDVRAADTTHPVEAAVAAGEAVSPTLPHCPGLDRPLWW